MDIIIVIIMNIIVILFSKLLEMTDKCTPSAYLLSCS